MGIKNGKRNSYQTAEQRRNEIISLLITGMLKAESAIKPLSEKLSESSQKALELWPETRLSVSTG